MLATPTPSQAFAPRAQQLLTYQRQEPVWAAWAAPAAALWTAAASLDAPGLATATQALRALAQTLDALAAQAPAQVVVWRALGPQVAAAWQTWAGVARRTPTATPTQTVRLTLPAQTALAALTAWDPPRALSTPRHPGALALTLARGIQVVAAPTVPTPGPTGGIWHVVRDTDTLWSLATRYYGDPARWTAIAEANQLRDPYLSARLWDVYGPPAVGWVLTTGTPGGPWTAAPPVAAGATAIPLPGLQPGQVPVGSVLVLEAATATGRQQQAVTVTALVDGVATVTPAVTAAYPTGSLLGAMLPPAWRVHTVAQPGTAIQIPGTTGTAVATPPAGQDPWGADLALTADGDWAWTPTGDLAVASGAANVLGALTRGVDTALGTLALHPRYGSGLATVIGGPVGVAHVVTGYVQTALAQNARVVRVANLSATLAGTTWTVTGQVTLVGSPTPLPWVVTLPMGGG